MRELQAQIIEELHVVSHVDPAAEIRARIDFLKDYHRASSTLGFVLGISGGQDSSLAGRICQIAVDELVAEGRTARFVAVRLPYGAQHDEADAQLAMRFIEPDEVVELDVQRGVDGLAAGYVDAMASEMSDFVKGNVKARMRMVAQYAIAGERGLLVVGTDHAAEAVTGFFTKYGDGGADVTPLIGLTKRQGRRLLEHLGAPSRLYMKMPTADLLDEAPGQPDEANLGLQYRDIDDYLEGVAVDDATAERIETKFVQSRHKREMPASLFDAWWRR